MGETKGERKQLAIKNNNLSKFKGKAFCKRILIIKIYQSCKKKKKNVRLALEPSCIAGGK